MAKKRKTPIKRKPASVRVKGRASSRFTSGKQVTSAVGRFVLPLVIICILCGAIGVLAISGYQTVTASSFFGLKNVDIRGTERTPAEDMRRLVAGSVEKTGVWNADLGDMRSRIEKYPFVKSAAVSRILPAEIRVNVIERIPAAIVRLSSGDYLVDGDGVVLTLANGKSPELPVVLRGWDESKTEKAGPENIARLKLYRKMLDEWKQFDLVSHVKEVNVSNPRQPVAIIDDSGRPITVTLDRNNIGKSLKTAIEAVGGKRAKVAGVDASGISPVIQYLDF